MDSMRIIVRPGLKEMVFQAIKDSIIREELKPSQRLTEIGLARKLGVGQATVREALIELEGRGFIQRRDRNKYVTALSRPDIEAIYAVRVPLEKLAAATVALKENKDLRGMEEAQIRMAEAARLLERSQFKDADYDFHAELWAATGNNYLRDVLDRLVPQLFAFAMATLRQYNPSPAILQKLADLHRDIIEGIRAGDVKMAQEALVASMDMTWIEVSACAPETSSLVSY